MEGSEMGAVRTDIPELAAVLDGADHVDVKNAESELTLREFVAAALGARHWWVTALFGARAVLAWLLRLDQAASSTTKSPLRPEQLPLVPGAVVSFFTVTAAQEDRFLLLEASDTHLTGYLAFVVDPADQSAGVATCWHIKVITVVHFHRWTGPLYFTIIRPFHHLVVGSMVRAGARGVRAAGPSGPEPEQSRAGIGQRGTTAGEIE
jgi:hypothetical protein